MLLNWLRWQNVVDFVVLTVAFYLVLIWAKQTRALHLALLIVGFHAAALWAGHFDLTITSWVFEGACLAVIGLLVLLFQAELQHSLLRLDSIAHLRFHAPAVSMRTYDAIVGASPSMSPTVSLAKTEKGMILGTAAYMSPEQARGYPADKRADIWAFGVVFYEPLTGKMIFGDGKNISDSLAAVLTREPDFTVLPKDTPPRVRRLLERCLRKDPKQRLRDIGEARIILDEPEPAAPAAAPARRRLWVAGLAALAVLAALALYRWLPARPAGPFQHIQITRLTDSGKASAAAISPDGKYVVHVVTDEGKSSLWLLHAATGENAQDIDFEDYH